MFKFKGVALIQVLFMTAIMAIIAIQFTKTARNQVSIAKDFNNRVEAELKLKSAKSRVLYNLFKHDSINLMDRVVEGKKWNLRGVPFSFDDDVTVKVTAATAYLSLITSPNSYIQKLLRNSGADDHIAVEISESLEDWIDGDNIEKANGAEHQYYSTKNTSPRNGPLQHISELLVIKGMTQALYEKVKESVTIYTTNSINPALMSANLAEVIFNPDIAQQIKDAQSSANFTENTWLGIVGNRQFDFVDLHPGSIFMIEIKAQYEDVIITEKFDVKVESQKSQNPISILSNY